MSDQPKPASICTVPPICPFSSGPNLRPLGQLISFKYTYFEMYCFEFMVHMHMLVLTKNQTYSSGFEAFSLAVSFLMTFSSYAILEGTFTCSS